MYITTENKAVPPIYTVPFRYPLDIRSVEDEEEFVTHYLWVILDKSLSMKNKEDEIYQEMARILAGLAEANQGSTDTRIRVKIALFNHEISNFNDVHLDPQQLLNTFGREDYRCSGTTSAGAVSRYIDKELSRTSPVVRSLKKNSPGFTFVLLTDGQVNDPVSLREDARKILESNRFYRDYSRVLVVYLGREEDKATAVAMANGEEQNVVALGNDLTSMLSPLIIQSTVTFADGTHMSNCDSTQSFADMADSAKKRAQEGTTSADNLADQDLRNKLLQLMGKKGGTQV